MIPNNQNTASPKEYDFAKIAMPLLNSHISTNFLSPAVHPNVIRFISGACYVKHEVLSSKIPSLQQPNGGISEGIVIVTLYMFEGT
jgi:hypothetical protein